MTITLTPATETLLLARAVSEGMEIDILADILLRNMLTEPREPTEEEKEAAFDLAMLTAGLVSRIPPPRDPSKAQRTRIEVQGEPLSETIIRERR